jgi:hypothetical protein
VVRVTDEDDISSDAAGPRFDFGEPTFDGPPPLEPDDVFNPPKPDPGPSGPKHAKEAAKDGPKIDAEIKSTRLSEKPVPKEGDKPKAGPPTLEEWQDFFARIVFLTLAEWYVTWCFRGVPEDIISEEDLKRCTLSKEERQQIALPLSELANKSSVARKHGRQVIAFFESFEAIILIGMWMSKVHRIASKYRPRKEKRPVNVRVEQNAPPSNGSGGAPGFDPNVSIFNPGTG